MLGQQGQGTQYAQGALAQLLAFSPMWQGHALQAGIALQGQGLPHLSAAAATRPEALRAGTASPGAGEERGAKTTNYAARHQVCTRCPKGVVAL